MPSLVAAVVSLVVPPSCLGCGAPLASPGGELCGPCRRALPWLGATCPACALPQPCGPGCRGGGAAWAHAWAPLAHAGPAREIVLALKHGRRTRVARTMAAQVVASAPPGLLDAPGAVLVPVPADPWRSRRRGLDQAALLAREVGRRTGLEVVCALRRPLARPQVGRGRAARLEAGGRLSLAVRQVPGCAVLVDDVHTTGATLDACARALRGAGTRWVGAVSYTRAVAPGRSGQPVQRVCARA